MKKAVKILGLLMAVMVSLVAFLYLLMTNLYSGRFGVGVWVNNIYATGLKASEVTQLLDRDTPDETMPETIMILDRNGNMLSIPTASLKFYKSYRASVRDLLKRQNPLTWFKGLTGGIYLSAEPRVSYELTALENAFDSWEIFERKEPEEPSGIQETPAGYRLVLHSEEVPVKNRMIEKAADAISMGQFLITLDEDDCYETVSDVEETTSLLKTWAAIQETRTDGLKLLLGEEELVIDGTVTDEWLLTEAELIELQTAEKTGSGRAASDSKAGEEGGEEPDQKDKAELPGPAGRFGAGSKYLIGGAEVELPEGIRAVDGFAQTAAGKLIIKEDDIDAFVDALCEKYSTLSKTRDFKTADGRVVQVPPGTYGNEIDAEAEKAWLKEAVKNHTKEEHVPALLHEARQLGENDIGDTYIEVDITNQKLYYFENGQLDTELPVVTGCVAKHCDTPPGVYDIYFMQRNRTLRGPGYASFVSYWMAFYKSYGLHDASWRSKFGDEIYKTSGSHGCVNLPKADTGALYDKVEVGVPVIVHE